MPWPRSRTTERKLGRKGKKELEKERIENSGKKNKDIDIEKVDKQNTISLS
jgi:hypothetical protein